MAESRGTRTVTIRAVSYDAPAAERPVPYAIPYRDTEGGECFEYGWRLIHYVFDLPDPTKFPPLPAPLPSGELRIATRYVAAADELATSPFLRAPSELSIPNPADPSTLTFDRPAGESIRGFSVLFRQFNANDERASFQALQRILRAANTRADDPHQNLRTKYLTDYARAVGRARAYQIRVLAGHRLYQEGRLLRTGPLPGEDISPAQLISRYHYGEDIHWGDKSEDIDALDPVIAAFEREQLFDALAGLTYLFLGFAFVVRSAIRL